MYMSVHSHQYKYVWFSCCSGSCPTSVGTMFTPSCSGRAAASTPARAAAVGSRSQKVNSVALFREFGAMCPGQEAKIVCRIPPSCKLRFFPRKGPGSSKSDCARVQQIEQRMFKLPPRQTRLQSVTDSVHVCPAEQLTYKVVIVRTVVAREKNNRIVGKVQCLVHAPGTRQLNSESATTMLEEPPR